VLYELDDKAFAAKIDENNKLTPIEEDEWNIVEEIYEQYQQENNLDDEPEESEESKSE
jgi:hypothetical protein